MSRRVRRRLARLHAPRHAAPPAAEAGPRVFDRRPRTGTAVVALVAAAAAGALGGPVAAAAAAVYAGVAASAWLGRRREARLARDRAATIDAVGMLAADLRAGLPSGLAMAAAGAALTGALAHRRLNAAWQLSERIGAPLADLLDRVESELRATEQVRRSVASQTAGARATAWILGALPLAGVALGYAMGADPARSLLHTPLGAGCAFTALTLQCAGLAWTSVLVRGALSQEALR
jgi:tight adherence protein B